MNETNQNAVVVFGGALAKYYNIVVTLLIFVKLYYWINPELISTQMVWTISLAILLGFLSTMVLLLAICFISYLIIRKGLEKTFDQALQQTTEEYELWEDEEE